jgi:CSLREA domain-containing protein
VRRLLLVAGLLAATLADAGAAAAATITPTVLVDDNTVNGNCTLREAIRAANTDAAVDQCPPGSGADTIVLPPGVYQLSVGPPGDDAAVAGDLDIIEAVTITGAGAHVTTVDGAGLDRVFDLVAGVDSTLITDLTITGGSTGGDGGGIRADSPLELRRSIISGNETTGLGDGGGISLTNDMSSRVTMLDSTVAGNTSASWGGGVFLYESLSPVASILTNVTVSGNVADDTGGGIVTYSPHPVFLNNLTITGNRADVDNAGTDGGGGIWAGSEDPNAVVISNTIMAGNTSGLGAGPDCDATNPGSVGLTSHGHNIIGIGDDCSFTATTGDLVGTLAVPVDPMLGPLTDNGGPTPTHPLLSGSPAIDGGDQAQPGSGGTACADADQRGAQRQGPCDIGAYELVRCKTAVVNRLGTEGNDVLTGTAGSDGFLAGGGNDRVNGLGGNDAACLGAGKDRASGGGGKDRLFGEGGKDTLRGGGGKDLLVCGPGKGEKGVGGPGKDKARQCEGGKV